MGARGRFFFEGGLGEAGCRFLGVPVAPPEGEDVGDDVVGDASVEEGTLVRAELLELRRGPSAVRAHERLFLDRSIPDDVVAHVLAFWRSDRDA